MPPEGEIVQLGIIGVVVLLLLFYGGTMWMSFAISRKKENADDYMTAGNKIGFGDLRRLHDRDLDLGVLDVRLGDRWATPTASPAPSTTASGAR